MSYRTIDSAVGVIWAASLTGTDASADETLTGLACRRCPGDFSASVAATCGGVAGGASGAELNIIAAAGGAAHSQAYSQSYTSRARSPHRVTL